MITLIIINTTIAFLGVSCAFWLEKPSLFLKKPSGALSPISYLIYWPYWVMNTIALGLFRVFSRENVFDEIVPNLYLGCQLWRGDYKRFMAKGIKSTLDLTAEFGEVGFIQTISNYLCLPVLDTRAPTLWQLEEGAEWIRARLSEGPVFVHCALGHGRSATMVAGFLIKQGIVHDAQAAIAFIQAIRPSVNLHPKQLKVLVQYCHDEP